MHACPWRALLLAPPMLYAPLWTPLTPGAPSGDGFLFLAQTAAGAPGSGPSSAPPSPPWLFRGTGSKGGPSLCAFR